MNEITSLFNKSPINLARLQQIEQIPDPRSRYLIAITPRSGSSYLCNAMKNSKRLGWPQEVLEQNSMAIRLTKDMPGRTPEEYFRNTFRATKTPNGVSGLKTSWFQFENFMMAIEDHKYLQGIKYIYLTRRDLAAQAVSLFKAVSSNIFHSVTEPGKDDLATLSLLEYDYSAIKYWYDHIIAQEKGWQQYFYDRRIFPLCLSYEEIEDDIIQVIKRIAIYVGVNPDKISFTGQISDFQKIRNEQNTQWVFRFAKELTSHAN